MDYGSDFEIRQSSPLSRRRRRRAQQQSTCCGCFLLAFIVAASVVAIYPFVRRARDRREEIRRVRDTQRLYFPVEISTDAASYLHHQVVRLNVRFADAGGRPLRPKKQPPVVVRHKGQTVECVGGEDTIPLKYDPGKGLYVGNWPVPWNADPGAYAVEVRYPIPSPATFPWETAEEELERKRKAPDDKLADVAGDALCVARSRFEVRSVQRPAMEPGMCVATWEQMLPGAGVKVRKPSGEPGDWRAILDWCQFMGADTLWVRAAVTQSEQEKLTLDNPFVQSNFRLLPSLAAEAHKRGIKVGAWAMAYGTLPITTNADKPDYQYAQDISVSTGKVRDTTFVSLLDQRRVEHLAAFMAAMQRDPNVDFVGLDYIRTEHAYELVEGFVNTMPVSLPPEWPKMTRSERWLYVCRRVEPRGCYANRDFWDMWNWYRAHLGAQRVSEMLRASGLQKPLWVFSLSWRHGKEHGQDPIMFTDAGVSMVAPMLYHTDPHFFDDFILKEWPQYVRAGQVNIVAGDQIDDPCHQGLGPGELYRRMVSAHYRLLPRSRTQGAFVHDISRAAVRGSLGPYPATEWALAGGAAFTAVRQSWRVYPLEAELSVPAKAAAGTAVPVTLTLRGTGEKAVNGIRIEPMPSEGVVFDRPGAQTGSVGPGQTLTIPFRVKIAKGNTFRQNRFMVAFRVTWPQGEYGGTVRSDLPRVITMMKYITVQ